MRKENTVNQGLDENLICRSLDACIRKRGMTGKKCLHKRGMTFLFCLLSGVAHAECTPVPDCASIGYTATSCDGDALKCPFDTSKLYCVPCDSAYKYTCSNVGEIGKGNSCNGKYIECGCADGYEVDGSGCKLSCASSYQYTCSGTGYSGGSGTACGGKYTSCTCVSGYVWKNGLCQPCGNSCTVGSILYSDGTCNSCVVSGKTAIGVVVKDNELVISQRYSVCMAWGTYGTDLSLDNFSFDQVKEDFNGKSNTATIIAEDSGAVAAEHCNNYTTVGTSAGDWYLPAAGELYSYVYSNYNVINTTMTSLGWTLGSTSFWSSSEQDGSAAWVMGASTGNMTYGYKSAGNNRYVSCFLEIN